MGKAELSAAGSRLTPIGRITALACINLLPLISRLVTLVTPLIRHRRAISCVCLLPPKTNHITVLGYHCVTRQNQPVKIIKQ